MELTKTFTFEAAHHLTRVPEGHKCGRVHGHSYTLSVTIRGIVDDTTGWVQDFGDIAKPVKALIDAYLDHYDLNDILPNPTSELLCEWAWRKLILDLPLLVAVGISETCTSACELRPVHLPPGPPSL